MTETDYYGDDRTCVEAYHEDGRLTGLSFWAERADDADIDLDEPYDKEMVEQIADLYRSEKYCCIEDFHVIAGTAHTLKDVLERLDGTFDYGEFFDDMRRKGQKILLSKLKESPQAMLDSINSYYVFDWARYVKLNGGMGNDKD